MKKSETLGIELAAYKQRRKLSVEEMICEIQTRVPALGGMRCPETKTYLRWERGEAYPQTIYRIAIEKLLGIKA